jgi:hypothetical protein
VSRGEYRPRSSSVPSARLAELLHHSGGVKCQHQPERLGEGRPPN